MITVYHTQEDGRRPRVVLTAHSIEDTNFGIAQWLHGREALFMDPKPHQLLIEGHDELTGEYITETL